jgi:hypothetical protein
MEGQIMPMVAAKLQSAIETRIYNALSKEFEEEGKKNKEAKKAWKRQAKVISEIALDIVDFLMMDVQVAPGIPTAGSPAAQATTAPGKLM